MLARCPARPLASDLPLKMRSMGNYNNFDCTESERVSEKILGPSQPSYMIGKPSGSSNSNGRREWSQVSSSTPTPPPPASHGTIRVIHIFAPKIIKTDVANFRELVQRLTGKTKRSRSGNTSKRGAKYMSSPPRAQQILSEYCNATQIFASSNRVEYTIPRSSDPYFSQPFILDFNKQEEDVKPVRMREPACVDFSGSSSDQSSCSPFPLAEVTSPYFKGHQLQDPSSARVDCRSVMASKDLKSCGSQQQQQVPSSKPIMVDPFQSLSGYREKLLPTPQKPSSITSFPLFDDRNPYMFDSRFSDMDILTGLVTPGHLPEFPMALPAHVNNSSSDFTFQSSQLNNPNSLCRFLVQSPLRGSIPQLFENF